MSRDSTRNHTGKRLGFIIEPVAGTDLDLDAHDSETELD